MAESNTAELLETIKSLLRFSITKPDSTSYDMPDNIANPTGAIATQMGLLATELVPMLKKGNLEAVAELLASTRSIPVPQVSQEPAPSIPVAGTSNEGAFDYIHGYPPPSNEGEFDYIHGDWPSAPSETEAYNPSALAALTTGLGVLQPSDSPSNTLTGGGPAVHPPRGGPDPQALAQVVALLQPHMQRLEHKRFPDPSLGQLITGAA